LFVAISLASCDSDRESTTGPVQISAADVAGDWSFDLRRESKCSGQGVDAGTISAVIRASERGDSIQLAGSWTGPPSQEGPWPLLGVIDRRTGNVLIDFWSLVNEYGWRATGTIANDLTLRGRGVDAIPGADAFFTEPPCAYALSATKVR
jgi:hypothetical protein